MEEGKATAHICAACRMPVRPVNECICDDEDESTPEPDAED